MISLVVADLPISLRTRNVLMPRSSSQTFRRELDKKLRAAADRLRSNLGLSRQSETAPDAAVYKHAVLGLNPRNGDLPPAMSAMLPFRIASSSSPARAIRRSPLPNLAGLIDLIATLPFQHADLHANDIRGHDAESPHSNSISAPLGGLCAFAVKISSSANRECAPLKSEGTPQVVNEARDKNANFAWVQHMLHHLAPNGSMALLLVNGSMSSNSSGEGDIRRALIEADLVECMVALPGQLFINTPIPACIWFLTKNKAKRARPGAAALRDRRGETLFIDAREFCPGQGDSLLAN